MALLARQLYFEAVELGDDLPPLVKSPVDRTQIARYAGASGDFNPLYVDEPFAKNAGFPSVYVPGMLIMGFVAELAIDWLRGARVRRYTARFVKLVWPGDVITCFGRITDRRFEGGGVYALDLEVWAENQRGELVLKGAVTALPFYDAEDDARQRAGQPPLIVTPEEEAERFAKLSRAQPPKHLEAPSLPSHQAPTVTDPAPPPSPVVEPKEREAAPTWPAISKPAAPLRPDVIAPVAAPAERVPARRRRSVAPPSRPARQERPAARASPKATTTLHVRHPRSGSQSSSKTSGKRRR